MCAESESVTLLRENPDTNLCNTVGFEVGFVRLEVDEGSVQQRTLAGKRQAPSILTTVPSDRGSKPSQ